MRRWLLVAALSSFAVTSATAWPLTLGVSGGSSIPNLRDNSNGNELSSGWSTRVAPFFGLSAEWSLDSPWSLRAEVDYAAQGGRRDGLQRVTDGSLEQAFGGMPLYADFKNTAKLDYIEIPLLAKYTFGGRERLSVMAGPYVGLLVSAKTVTSGTSTVYLDKARQQPVMLPTAEPLVLDFGATTDNKSSLNVFNWGLQAGVGTAHPLGAGRVTLDVRVGLGLANIQKDTAADGKNTTGNVAIAAGYALPLSSLR